MTDAMVIRMVAAGIVLWVLVAAGIVVWHHRVRTRAIRGERIPRGRLVAWGGSIWGPRP